MRIGWLMIGLVGCAGSPNTETGEAEQTAIYLGRPVMDPFSDRIIALTVEDARRHEGVAPQTYGVGMNQEAPIQLADETVANVVRRAVTMSFRRAGISVPEDPDPATAIPITVVVERLWLKRVGGIRIQFDGAFVFQTLKQKKKLEYKFDLAARGAGRRARPYAKVMTKGLVRMQDQFEELGRSLARTSTSAL